MNWTWALDEYVVVALTLGTAAGVLLAVLWGVAGGLRLLRNWKARAAVLLPLGLWIGLGWVDRPVEALFLFAAWVAAEAAVSRLLKVRWGTGAGTPGPAAAFAVVGALACLAGLWLGPPGAAGALLFSRLGQLALLGALVSGSLSALALGRRVITSPVLRAACCVALVLTWDGLYLARGGWAVYLLGLPMLYELVSAARCRMTQDGSAGRRRFAAAGVWVLALAGLIVFSRFNMELSRTRSTEVIAACRRYEADHGRLPTALEELVPTYLSRVPLASWTVLGGFHYSSRDEHVLSYFAPWPDLVAYVFEDGRWGVDPGVGVSPFAQSNRPDADASGDAPTVGSTVARRPV